MTASATLPRSTSRDFEDTAPTRLRWEQLPALPSDAEVTRVVTGPSRVTPVQFFEPLAPSSDARGHALRSPPADRRFSLGGAMDPFPLTRRSTPSEPPRSGPRPIGKAPPAHAWRDESAPRSREPRSREPWSAAAARTLVTTRPVASSSTLRLILITCTAFAVTLVLLFAFIVIAIGQLG